MFHFKSNTGYYAKSLCLALAIGLLFFLACGDDEKQLDLMTPEPPSLSEQLVGSWEVVSIDGETVEEAFTSLTPSVRLVVFVVSVVARIKARVLLGDVDVIVAGEVGAEILKEKADYVAEYFKEEFDDSDFDFDVIVVADDVAEILKEKKGIDDFDVDVFVVADVDTTVPKFDMVFAANGSVFVNFSFARRERAAVDVVGGGVDFDNYAVHEGVRTFSYTLKGTYTVSGSTMTVVWEDANPDLDLDYKYKIEEGGWKDYTVEREEVEEIEREFRRDFSLDIDVLHVDLSGDTLTLTDDDGSKRVLKKR